MGLEQRHSAQDCTVRGFFSKKNNGYIKTTVCFSYANSLQCYSYLLLACTTAMQWKRFPPPRNFLPLIFLSSKKSPQVFTEVRASKLKCWLHAPCTTICPLHIYLYFQMKHKKLPCLNISILFPFFPQWKWKRDFMECHCDTFYKTRCVAECASPSIHLV